MQTNSHIPTRILRLPEVMSRTGQRKTSIYAQIKAGIFPQQIRFGASVGWIEEEIETFIRARIAASRLHKEAIIHDSG